MNIIACQLKLDVQATNGGPKAGEVLTDKEFAVQYIPDKMPHHIRIKSKVRQSGQRANGGTRVWYVHIHDVAWMQSDES